jgi:hypothetical protein
VLFDLDLRIMGTNSGVESASSYLGKECRCNLQKKKKKESKNTSDSFAIASHFETSFSSVLMRDSRFFFGSFPVLSLPFFSMQTPFPGLFYRRHSRSARARVQQKAQQPEQCAT